jgi:hypothetical protein
LTKHYVVEAEAFAIYSVDEYLNHRCIIEQFLYHRDATVIRSIQGIRLSVGGSNCWDPVSQPVLRG